MAHVTLSLSYHDLERLLNTEDPIALEIKAAIVHEFCKRNLVTLLRDELTEKWKKELEYTLSRAASKEIQETIGTVSYNSVIINPAIRQTIRGVVEAERDKMVRELIDEVITEESVKEIIEKKLTAIAEPLIRVYAFKYIQDHMQAVVDEALAQFRKKKNVTS